MLRLWGPTAIAFSCGLIAALLFFTAAPGGEISRSVARRSAAFSVERPEISFTAVRLFGLAAY
jgi:hypothetical protein